MSDDFTDALFIAQTLVQRRLADGPLTREVIADGVDRTLAVEPRWRATVDPEALCRELETRFNIWIGQEQTLIGRDDHVAWLDAGRKQGWRYWGRYRQHLASDLAPASLDAIDRVTDHVLGLLEDPQREGAWDRRGLVVGHVQSGKTASYIGLICKAADAGYKLVVVLAGLHKNLRSQTQKRLDEGFLGYETMPPGEVERRAPQPAGVGLLDPTLRPNYVTNRSDNGDFSRAVANNMGINPGADPLLFVVKKNARVLRNLLDWVHWAANAREPETGRPLVRDVPLLVIDDEADHASVDTREQAFDENGNPDPDHDPTAINGCIRRLLRAFEKTAYVGYTATPFANIFIHERGETTDEGEDLFPRSFIVNLSAPSNYVGPTRVFGLEPQNEGEGLAQLPLIRHVADHADSLNLNERNGWMPPSHRNGHVPLCNGVAELPLSLQEAIRAFVLSCAARRARGQNREHNTMLVHVTRYTAVQQLVRDQIDAYLASLRLRLRHGDGSRPDALEIDLRELWQRDFEPTTRAVAGVADDRDIVPLSWESVTPHLANVADDIHIRQINGTAGDILEYERHQETGLNVIAVGGDKLSRGLTLAGLTVSYFLRASRMYDTLMQMGRWFGYRPGYLDLCRLYTTADLEQWFQHIAEAGEELRREFDHMAAVGGTPRDYGLKVKSHPVLMVTSQVKMRHGTTLHLSFESDTPETVVFHRDTDVITRNLRTSTLLLSRLGVPFASPVVAPRAEGSHQWDSTHLWRGVPATHILGFLSGYTTHPSAIRVNTRLLTEYIERQNARGELVQWTVVLLGNGEGPPMELEGLGVRLTKRAPNQRSRSVEEQRRDGLMIIRRLLSPRDVAVDLNAGQYAEALRLTQNAWQADPGRSSAQTPPDYPSTRAVASQRDPSTGLLLIYPVDPEPAGLDTRMPVMGFGISFPHSTGAPQVAYEVNNVYWTQEVAGA